MKAVKKVEPQNWMTSPETRAVMAALGDGKALFVGGCVRNMLMGFPVEDVDIATRWLPDQVMDILGKAGIKVIPTGIDHGTVTAVVNKKHYEITTLRRDVETDGRRAVVAFTEKWDEDALRRDFTMNTLLADATGNVFDPTGDGLRDLEAGRVRFVGDAATRIAEDYLRILRFFRFYAIYGKGAPDEDGLKACRSASDTVRTLSKERITQEFFRILSVDNPVHILGLMFSNNVLKEFSFVEYEEKFFKYLCELQNRYNLAFIASRLFAVAGLEKNNVKSMEKLLLIPKVFKKDVDAINEVLKSPDLSEEKAVRVSVYKYGRTVTAQALMIEVAQDRVMNGYAPKALEILQKWDIPQFPLSGEDLKCAGIKEGPEMGRKLHEIEEWWVQQDFAPGKKECVNQIKFV